MGNIVCRPSGQSITDHEESPIDWVEALGVGNILTKELSETERNDKLLDELLNETQQHNLELMKLEIRSDINMFILNNLLLGVQFFDNFDKAMVSAKTFKREIERELTDKLTPLANDGVIHGERRCFLTHGLPQEIVKNYIYVDKVAKEQKFKSKENITRFKFGDEMQRCESIIPLEFNVTWDNLEIYKESEYETLRDYEYSAAKGTVEINRFCMEEPKAKNTISKGYVRLRCVDIPKSMKQTTKMVDEKREEQECDYNQFSELSEEVDEVQTESDVATSDYDECLTSGNALMRDLETRLHMLSKSLSANTTTPSTSVALQNENFQMTKKLLGERRPSGVLPQGYPKLSSDRHHIKDSINSQIVTTDPKRENLQLEDYSNRSTSELLLRPVPRNEFLSPFSNYKGTQSKILPKLDNNGNLIIQQSASSGYESVSSAVSHGSSLTSEDVREKWRKVEIKKLWQFPPKRRRGKGALPGTSFLQVQIPVDSDEEGSYESDSNSDSSDTSIDVAGHNRRSKNLISGSKLDNSRKLAEPKYEPRPRTYLNSLAFSTDFCSEFMQIGSQMGLAGITLQNAIVVGTTVRCSVLYPPGLLNTSGTKARPKDSFHFLYTFTPSIQSKYLPQLPLIWWKNKMLKNGKSDNEKWPQPHHVELIETLGTNIIPLGHRSINNTQYENLENQTLEWQVGYAQAENVLLNNLRSVHWRALIFASILYRAFLVPLGPLGIGIEHFRNILYQMCHQEFISWNDEQPGLHLLTLVQRVYSSLAQGVMQNFFIRDHNMLKNIPIQNARIIQSQLKKVQDNVLVCFIHAFQSLKPMRTDSYGMPDFLKLYKIITTRNEKDLLSWAIMTNPSISRFGSSQGTVRKRKVSKKRRRQQKRENNLKRSEVIESGMNITNQNGLVIEDKHRQKLIKKRLQWEKRQNRKEDASQTDQELDQAQNTHDKKSFTFNLDIMPVKRYHYSSVRLALLLKYFVEHFLHMAEKSAEYRAYSQAAMYVLHTENLCEILSSIETEALDAIELKDRARQLRERIGVHQMREYIRSKNSKFSTTEEAIDPLSSLSMKPDKYNDPSDNIILGNGTSRELPEPPNHPRPRLEAPTIKKIPTPNIMQSLRSLPTAALEFSEDLEMSSPSSTEKGYMTSTTHHLIPRVKDPSLVRRIPSIKFIESPIRKVSSESGSFQDFTHL